MTTGKFGAGSLGIAPGAKEAKRWAILGFFFFGFVCGPLAIKEARRARAFIAEDPRYGGADLARTGLILGWIDTVLWVLGLVRLVVETMPR